MSDRHIRRSGKDYAHALSALLPQGLAWPRDPESLLMRVVTGLAGVWGFVDGRAADLLERESDPRKTVEILPEWERAFGLPDPCLDEPLTIAARQKVLVHRMTLLGAQSRAFFIQVALDLGHVIQIREHAPFMTGISRCGVTLDDMGYMRWEVGPAENRFYWNVRVDQVKLMWFRAGSGVCGIDPLLRIGRATDLECIFGRWKPAHTRVLFNYWGSQATFSGTNTFTAYSREQIISASFAGTGGLSARVMQRNAMTAQFSGAGTVKADMHEKRQRITARFQGQGNLLAFNYE